MLIDNIIRLARVMLEAYLHVECIIIIISITNYKQNNKKQLIVKYTILNVTTTVRLPVATTNIYFRSFFSFPELHCQSKSSHSRNCVCFGHKSKCNNNKFEFCLDLHNSIRYFSALEFFLIFFCTNVLIFFAMIAIESIN